jgi:hypothetical protein
VPLTCPGCGHYRREVAGACAHCGTPVPPGGPLLVVTGAAAAGKSTVCAALARLPGMLALDGDVLAAGAAAVADGRRDYAAFWAYLLELAREVQDNGLIPAYACVCLPEQVLANPAVGHFAAVHFLVLTCDGVAERIAGRRGAPSAVARTAVHVELDAVLRRAVVPAPHTLTVLDTTGSAPAGTVAAAVRWAEGVSGSRR